MTDHKFTDDDVIKALECCKRPANQTSCDDCPYQFSNEKCSSKLIDDALALINRQKAEIESLNAIHADALESLRLAAEANKDMQAEIERLKREAKIDESEIKCIRIHRDMARAEAIKEFAERLKAKEAIHFCKCGQPFVYTDLFNGEIGNIVKEMTEKSE
jgi:hypothetical protein